jgi:hypothetical protein
MFRDAVALIIPFYRQVVPELHVGSRVPSPRPPVFVRVWRTGGAASSRILDHPILTTQVWGTEDTDEDELPDIANRLRTALYGRSSLIPPVRGVEEVSGVYEDPDPVSGAPRVTFSSQLNIRATM